MLLLLLMLLTIAASAQQKLTAKFKVASTTAEVVMNVTAPVGLSQARRPRCATFMLMAG